MKRLNIPEPILDKSAEQEIWRCMEKGFAANRWRSDYDTFINRFAWVDPHYRLRGVNFLSSPAAELVIGLRGRAKPNFRGLQRLSDMHYYTHGGARRAASRHGLDYFDVSWQRLLRSKAGRLRQTAHPYLSLGAGTWEAVLTKRER